MYTFTVASIFIFPSLFVVFLLELLTCKNLATSLTPLSLQGSPLGQNPSFPIVSLFLSLRPWSPFLLQTFPFTPTYDITPYLKINWRRLNSRPGVDPPENFLFVSFLIFVSLSYEP